MRNAGTKQQRAIVALLCLIPTASTLSQTQFLETLDERLRYSSGNGLFRAEINGLLDAEAYYIDGNPPGLLFSDDDLLFSPRATLFLEAELGKHLYGLVQFRADRGFDPGADENGDARLDEYFLRYTPLEQPVFQLQVGKFATVFGNWVARHDSWENPLINAPLAYENVTIVSDVTAPTSPAAFLARGNKPDEKGAWLPVLWGPSYSSGVLISGVVNRFEYALEFKNASISSRPTVWDATDLDWENPTWSGRVGYLPSPEWRVGASASHGAYLLPSARGGLPPGDDLDDYNQTTVGVDLSYAWRHFQVWAEAIAASFEVPTVGDADTISYYLEAKYKWTPQLFTAARWGQQFFDTVNDGNGNWVKWDRDIWRAELALGYRFDRHLQTKLQYSYSRQEGAFQQGEQLLAAQVTLKF
ncbi:MAG: hypothetical protein SFY81_11700 [Verrucomicrobiota bacterium]|nr:hypothetical protein [Verrucomicrobiota bacterium]